MEEVTRLDQYKNPEILLEQLTHKVAQCNEIRQVISKALHDLQTQDQGKREEMTDVMCYLIAFEVGAIMPAQAYVDSVRRGEQSAGHVAEYIQILNGWLLQIEKNYRSVWENENSATIISLPQKAPPIPPHDAL